MKNCYINGMGCVSAQKTFESGFLEEIHLNETENVLFAQQPSYKEIIPPAAIRRMAKGVKMGIYASTQALKEANLEQPGAIITGTGMGCTEDSEKFLKAILDNKEEFLTPTSFIQSTHNTVGAQIALGLQCKNYNFTYVNGAVSLESALIDATMQIGNAEIDSALVGGIDETAAHTIEMFQLNNSIKKEEDKPYRVIGSHSKGVVFSEGAVFFALENRQTETSYAQIRDVFTQNILNPNQAQAFITDFLTQNDTTIDQVDAVVLGYNGDAGFDHFYDAAGSVFEGIPQLYYKHLSGEYNTASAFGLWMASHIMKNQEIPAVVSINDCRKEHYDTILLYNQYQGKDHSLILLTKC
ncbi:beta-ketoacyl synthase N-terminal-like domain-containing protein [Flavobacterium humi]|uniref:3-oxoacyl-ACP synthase n=1 Tax=Flavobacterium humi TaxID=2562683 RepID=A0A4Z0LA19_9FLAO|nr:beta-ketoacyl synthase N-terminal-like domain-containing protein [Flavobacterium humi]TGD59169.1 3-oxoacyl-ACP synthase [Flavobacterium humi]